MCDFPANGDDLRQSIRQERLTPGDSGEPLENARVSILLLGIKQPDGVDGRGGLRSLLQYFGRVGTGSPATSAISAAFSL